MNDAWVEASNAYEAGARQRAYQHIQQAIGSTPPTNRLLRDVHHVNIHVLTDFRTNPNPPPIAPQLPPEAPLALHIFAHHVALTAAYNRAYQILAQNRTTPKPRAQHQHIYKCAWNDLVSGLRHVPSVVRSLLPSPVSEKVLPLATNCFAHDDGNPSTDDVAWMHDVSNLVQTILTHLSTILTVHTDDTVQTAGQWADTAASTFELLVANAVLLHKSLEAPAGADAARSFRTLSQNLTPISPKATPRYLPPAPPTYLTSQYDTTDAHTVWLQALSLLQAGDPAAALNTILPTARSCLSGDGNGGGGGGGGSRSNGTQPRHGLNVMYLAAVLLLRHGGTAVEEAVQFATACAARSYRTADSLSLVARASRGRDALEKWHTALGVVGSPRLAGLWLTARAFGRVGMYQNQADMLQLAEEELSNGEDEEVDGKDINKGVMTQEHDQEHNAQDEDEEDGEDAGFGMVYVSGRWQDEEDADGVGRESVLFDVDVEVLRAERGRALCAAGKVREGWEVLRSCAGTDKGCGDVQMALAWAMVEGDNADNIRRDEAKEERMMQWERMGLALARAEGLLRADKVSESGKALEEAMRHGGIMQLGDSSAVGMMLRGVCYHNMAAVKVCKREVVEADEMFAAGQTALEKCGEEDDRLKDAARELAVMATLGRCVAMWMCGRKEDAVGHWVARRGLEDVGGIPGVHSDHVTGTLPPHVSTTVSEETLRQMDVFCVDAYQQQQGMRQRQQ